MKKDRSYVAISAIWYERFLECSRTYGTTEFPNSVRRFYNSLLNLDDGDCAIKTKVRKYIDDTWLPRVEQRVNDKTVNTSDQSIIKLEEAMVESELIAEVFSFIIQTIQDSGVGWSVYPSGSEAWDYADAIKD